MSRFVRGSGALTARASGPTPWRAASASAVGSLLEHYDFFLYAPLATLVFAKIFFPGQSDGAGLLLSLGTFAVGFLSRPLGGVLAGHLGDRLGRKRLLVATFLVTGSVTCAIGLLPTYAQIGPWAPVLLVALRFVQGIGMGGEWAGAALLAVEHAPHGRRGLFGSVAQAGAPLGIMVANGAVAVVMATLSPAQLLDWGWRLPFLFSAVLLAAGLVLRIGVHESPEFTRIRARGQRARRPVTEVVRHCPKQILAVIVIHVSDGTLGLVQSVFVLGFATSVLGLSPVTALLATAGGQFIIFAVAPLAGLLSDRFGRRPVIVAGACALAVWAFPLFWILDTRTVAGLFTAHIVSYTILSLINSPQATFFTELFEPRLRYSGMSLGFQTATVIGAGFGPIIAQALQNAAGGSTWSVSAYLMLVAVAALWATLTVRPAVAGPPAARRAPHDRPGDATTQAGSGKSS